MLLNRPIDVATAHLRRTVHIPPGLAGPGNPQRVVNISQTSTAMPRLINSGNGHQAFQTNCQRSKEKGRKRWVLS
jgi:hypothetical protein